MYVIWCSHVIHLSGETLNSCNNTLQYQREGNETVGWIEIQSPPSTKTLKLDIVLSLPGQLPSVGNYNCIPLNLYTFSLTYLLNCRSLISASNFDKSK